MRKLFSSLRVRLILLVIIAVVPAIFAIVYAGLRERDRAGDQAESQALQTAQLTAANYDQLVSGAQEMLGTLALLPQVHDRNTAWTDSLFASMLKQYPMYTNFGLADPNGNVFSSGAPLTSPVNVADRAWFQRAMVVRGFAIGDFVIGRVTGKPAVTFGYAAMDASGNTISVVFAALDASWLNSFAAGVSTQSPQTTFTLIDSSGSVLARYPDPTQYVGKNMAGVPVVATALAARTAGTAGSSGLDGQQRLFGYAPLRSDSNSPLVLIGIPEEIAYAAANQALATNLLLLALAMAVAIVAAWIVSSRFVMKPVGQLIGATRRLASGNLDARSGLAGSSEFGQLGSAFDEMGARLKQRQAALKESEEKYRGLFDSIRDGILMTDVPGNILETNQAFLDMLGYDRDEILTLTNQKITPEEYRRKEGGIIKYEVLPKGYSGEYDKEYIAKNGRLVPCSARVWSIQDEQGNVKALWGIMRDITERKQAERAREALFNQIAEERARIARIADELKRERDLLNVVMENAHTHLVYLDRDFNFVRVNSLYASTCGYRPEEMAGKNHFALYPHPENQAIFERVRDTGVPAFYQDKPFSFPDQPERGTTYWDWRLAPIKDSAGRVQNLVFSLIETTERKKAEEAIKASEERARIHAQNLQAVLDSVPAIIWISHDRESRVITGNRFAQKVLRVSDATNVSKTSDRPETVAHFRVFKDGNELAPEELPVQRVARSGKELRDYSFDIVFADGSVVSTLGDVVPVFDSHGNPAGAVAAFIDLTNRLEAERNLQTSLRFLEIANRHNDLDTLLGEFVAGIKKLSGCSSVGIRLLKESGMIPYAACDGFGKTFLEKDNDLSIRQDACACITVASGSANPSLPFYTRFGSFYSNDMEAFARLPESVKGKTRNVCNSMGYRSIVTVPLRMGEQIIGLIQVADQRPGMATPTIINQLEQVSTTLSIGVKRALAEADLRETTAYLENLFNYANAPIIVWDPEFRITRFNHAFERLTGLMADEVLGKSLDILFPVSQREDSMRLIARTLSGERFETVEISIQHRDGNVSTVLWNSATLFAADGTTPEATIAQGQDITNRKIAEEILRQTRDYLNNLLDYANAPIIVWDPGFHITRFNHAFERLTGLTSDDVIGKHLSILFPEEQREESMRQIRRTSSGERFEVVEIPILHIDGRVSTVLWNSATLYSADGKNMVATIAQGQDITARKAAEQSITRLNDELQANIQRLEAANRELEAFSYSVSHDLRAPLRAINGFSQVMLDDYAGKLDTEGKRYLDIIASNAGKMGQLINDLLAFSRLSRAPLTIGKVDVDPLVREVVQEQKTDGEAARRAIDVVIGDLPPARGDASMVRQIWVNLISNAVKFTRTRERARIEIGSFEQGGDLVYFIRDNGVGYDTQYSGKLFGVFQRLHRDDEFEGTGVGLAIVQRIVHRHGGRIWSESKLNEGAAFYFTLQQAREVPAK